MIPLLSQSFTNGVVKGKRTRFGLPVEQAEMLSSGVEGACGKLKSNFLSSCQMRHGPKE